MTRGTRLRGRATGLGLVLVVATAGGAAVGGSARAAPVAQGAPSSGVAGPAAPAGRVAPSPGSVRAGPDAGTVEPRRVERQVIPDKVRLGDPFVYRITLVHPAAQRWELRTPRDLGGFELLEQSRTRQDQGEAARTTYLLKMALFALGPQVLPTLTFDVLSADGAAIAHVDGPDIEAVSSLPKDSEQLGAKLEDIKPNEDVPVRSWRLLLWAAGALAAVAAVVLLRRAWLRRARAPAPPPPPLPLEERTSRELDALDAEGLPARGMQREFHFRLAALVRGYLGERFGFDALECTSGELLREVENRRLQGVDEPGLRRFVDQCDVARYARAEVSSGACASLLAWARGLVSATTPAPRTPGAFPDAAAAPAPSPRASHDEVLEARAVGPGERPSSPRTPDDAPPPPGREPPA